jgi:hypothetical protein
VTISFLFSSRLFSVLSLNTNRFLVWLHHNYQFIFNNYKTSNSHRCMRQVGFLSSIDDLGVFVALEPSDVVLSNEWRRFRLVKLAIGSGSYSTDQQINFKGSYTLKTPQQQNVNWFHLMWFYQLSSLYCKKIHIQVVGKHNAEI